jgi:hypothetical protein
MATKHRELRQANEILRRRSACFAEAELDRPLKQTGESVGEKTASCCIQT